MVLALGGGPGFGRTGFRYWRDPGAFAEYKFQGSLGKFVVAVTVTKARNPRLAMARAVKLTFFRILVFYVLSVLSLGMVVPYNSPELAFATKSGTRAAASPFVVAIKHAKIEGLDHVVNACLLIFVISAATSDYYIATRTVYSTASDGKAPKLLTRTNGRGVPLFAMVLPTMFCLLAYMSISSGAKAVFSYLTTMVATFGMLTWIPILITHIGFTRAVKVSQIPAELFPYREPLREWGSWAGLILLCILTIGKGFEVFIHGIDCKNFIVQYVGILVYLMCLFGYKIFYKTQRVRAAEVDRVTGVSTEPIESTRARQKAQWEEENSTKHPLIRVCRKVLAALL
ncbi:uncharacterized protein N7473_006410 [Penicillium subrubescens]|uniref:uncharacterized protein n=1 Tax=Penicillium subrubescens TaxID=1316194 RepID=UPI0025453605|nr:uncharacterized protein N7473_006410 [Penicillium subrubescens]KAJ5897011.1 hypothetical protein N7473_006410 [Penicillium subrubescens]